MATYLHFAPAVALAVALGPRRVGWRLMLAGALCGVAPDLDFLSVTMGFDRYNGTYGHRGFTHSLGFALLIGLLGLLWPSAGHRGWRHRVGTGAFLAACTLSHPLLDSLFNVGICSAWLWPLDGARHCLDWRPIPMRGVPLFGAQRLWMELQWIGVPLLVLANVGMLTRQLFRPRATRCESPVSGRAMASPENRGPRARRRQRVAYMNAVAWQWLGPQRLRQQRINPEEAPRCT
jgi:inner membrane protein